MKVNIYTIYDVVAEECGPVFQAKNDGVAYRMYKSLLSDNPNVNAEEYLIYCLGEFDTENRTFIPEDNYGRVVVDSLEELEEVKE